MNIPNFKDILQKLSVFKNNLSLLLPVAIGLFSILLLIPTQLMSRKLKAEMTTKSISMGKRVQNQSDSPVSRNGWKAEQQRQQEHAKDANEIALIAKRSTQRELLHYNVFLEPNDISSTLVFQEFGKHYRGAIDDLIGRSNAGDCPTEAEIERGLEDSAVNSRLRRSRSSMMGRSPMMGQPPMMGPSRMPSVRPMGNNPYGSYGRGRRFSEVENMVVDEICQERAKSISFYINPINLSGYDFWNEYKYDVKIEEAIEDCWYFQLGYWVIEDIFDTISTMNAGHDVLTAPVKHLTQVSFTMGLQRPGAGGRVFTGRRQSRQTGKDRDDVDKPIYVLTVDDGLTITCTGRFSSDESTIDVIHFNVAVILKIKEVLPFMQQLCTAKEHKFRGFSGEEAEQTFKHNQITILESKFKSVEEQTYSYYRYGEEPVVELDLICEYIFNRQGYEEIKPESVKETLKGEETAGR